MLQFGIYKLLILGMYSFKKKFLSMTYFEEMKQLEMFCGFCMVFLSKDPADCKSHVLNSGIVLYLRLIPV